MALTTEQYSEIAREYETIRDNNRELSQVRRFEVLSAIPEYGELEKSIGTLSVKCTSLMLDGETKQAEDVKEKIAHIRSRKLSLLEGAGYPGDYLDPIYSCGDCLDTGYVRDENGTLKKCHCLKFKETAILYEQSNIHEVLERENFSYLSFDHFKGESLALFEKAVAVSKKFVKYFGKDYQNILFYGTVGTGKTFLSNCIANEIIKNGYTVLYFSAFAMFERLAENAFDAGRRAERNDFYEALFGCDLLVLDDLGTELTNSFVGTELFACLNERHLRRRATIISTNLGLDEMRDRYSDRIFSRLMSNYEVCKLIGEDIRFAKKFA